MTRVYKGHAAFNFATSRENTWRDPRTNIILAPGAIRNWPTKAENELIEREYAMIRAALEEERRRKKKAAEKTEEFES